MARLTYAQKLAFAHTVAQFIRDNATELKDGGFDPAKKLAELENELKSAVELDVQQEALKAKLVEATDKAVKALDTTYSQASSLIDAMVGVIGKDGQFPLCTKQYPQGDREFPLCTEQFLQWTKRFPPGDGQFPAGDKGFPLCTEQYPRGDRRFPLWKNGEPFCRAGLGSGGEIYFHAELCRLTEDFI